jgi:competence protein ComEA
VSFSRRRDLQAARTRARLGALCPSTALGERLEAAGLTPLPGEWLLDPAGADALGAPDRTAPVRPAAALRALAAADPGAGVDRDSRRRAASGAELGLDPGADRGARRLAGPELDRGPGVARDSRGRAAPAPEPDFGLDVNRGPRLPAEPAPGPDFGLDVNRGPRLPAEPGGEPLIAGPRAAARSLLAALSVRTLADPGRRGVAALAVVAVLACAVAGWSAWRARPRSEPVDAVQVSAGVLAGGSPSPAAQVVVAVAGAVRRPGLVRLPPGSRVADAVRAAGGVRPGTDLGTLNLARKLLDGELVTVGAIAPTAGSPAGAHGPLVDLNTATVGELDSLPGVGPVLAQRIVDYRTEHGPFATVDQLREVDGIGESRFGELRGRVTV